VTNRVGGSLAALDPVTLTLRRTYPLHAGGPDDMGVAPDGKLWVSLRFHEQVAVLDPVSGDYETIDVGRSPHGIFLNTEMDRRGFLTAEAL
jgi:streptogramin lyase